MPATESIDLAGYVVRHIPPGPELEELLLLIRMGRAFRAQQRGRRPGFLRTYIGELVERLGDACTFKMLLDELEEEAARRAVHGEKASPVESVNRVWELVTIHQSGRLPRQVPFKTLQNTLTACKG